MLSKKKYFKLSKVCIKKELAVNFNRIIKFVNKQPKGHSPYLDLITSLFSIIAIVLCLNESSSF